MAASSYYELNDYPSSASHAPSKLYAGNGYDQNKPYSGTTGSGPEVYPMHTENTYNNAPPHPIDPPLKPLILSNGVSGRQPLNPNMATDNRLRQQIYQKWKRYLRILKIFTQIVTIIFTTIIFGLMLYMSIKFKTTESKQRGGRGPWHKDSKVWPTLMLLAGAGITLVLSVFLLLAYCCSYERAHRSWKLTIVRYTVHVGVWLVISVLYRYEKSLHNVDNDLWGWSCSPAAQKLQAQFEGVVNFKLMCEIQVSWHFSTTSLLGMVLTKAF